MPPSSLCSTYIACNHGYCTSAIKPMACHSTFIRLCSASKTQGVSTIILGGNSYLVLGDAEVSIMCSTVISWLLTYVEAHPAGCPVQSSNGALSTSCSKMGMSMSFRLDCQLWQNNQRKEVTNITANPACTKLW